MTDRYVAEPKTSCACGGQAGPRRFTVAGTPLDENTLLIETGLGYDFTEAMALSGSYRGEFGANAQDHILSATFSYRF